MRDYDDDDPGDVVEEDNFPDGCGGGGEGYGCHGCPDCLIDGVGFADPGGQSALRAATDSNPRNQSCPDCGAENVLTSKDVAAGYCCNRCADRNERGF